MTTEGFGRVRKLPTHLSLATGRLEDKEGGRATAGQYSCGQTGVGGGSTWLNSERPVQEARQLVNKECATFDRDYHSSRSSLSLLASHHACSTTTNTQTVRRPPPPTVPQSPTPTPNPLLPCLPPCLPPCPARCLPAPPYCCHSSTVICRPLCAAASRRSGSLLRRSATISSTGAERKLRACSRRACS